MTRSFAVVFRLAACVAGLLPVSGFGEDASEAVTSTPARSSSPNFENGLPRFGFQLSAGTLGAGVHAATAVTHRSNVRVGFNYFSYPGSVTKDKIRFGGTARLGSAEVLYDQYIAAGFHVSPGVAVYDGNRATGSASIPAGGTFTLNGVTYYSSNANPVSGTASIGARKIAPELLFGFGNLLPRKPVHFTLNLDMGVIFHGSPDAALNLTGIGCLNGPARFCAPVSNPAVQANVQAEQHKVNKTLSPYKYWPVVRMGFGYKF